MIRSSSDDIKRIRESGFFDENWYLEQYADSKAITDDPIEHYMRIGSLLHRNPSSRFDTSYYLKANPDVVVAGINPLLHYVLYGRDEGRSPVPNTVTRSLVSERIDVIVPVCNALEDVQKCLESLRLKHDGFMVQVLVINDASDEITTSWLHRYCISNKAFRLLEHPINLGYTKAVNTGLRASSAPYVILLNSDTVVTHGWIKAMFRCLNSSPRIGIVGPLSNAASWQSVPKLRDSKGEFFINTLPPGATPESMAEVIRSVSLRIYPRVTFINGFCFMIRRELVNSIGFMDEQTFPIGYGEENDYCIRAADAGFELAIADDAYVFHAKSRSFGHESRKALSAKGSSALDQKHSKERVVALLDHMKSIPHLDMIREKVAQCINQRDHEVSDVDIFSKRILFLLPVPGGGGGAHSVVQEVAEMNRLGVDARIAVRSGNYSEYLQLYHDVPCKDELFVTFKYDDLAKATIDYDIVVATIFNSVNYLRRILDINPSILPCYYVQDYEPFFFAPQTDAWNEASLSYTAIPGMVLFAKTHWIAHRVYSSHKVHVHKVYASIDHQVYHPRRRGSEKIRLAAMIRPQTTYRGADRTMRIFSALAREFKEKISIDIFGSSSDSTDFRNLQQDFEFRNHGVLTRREVASVLRISDIFVDLSDYQAFGRTALESMACGCTAVVPAAGGSEEYAVDGVNALVVDTLDESVVLTRLTDLIKNVTKLHSMQRAALETASQFSVNRAAISELNLFAREMAQHRVKYAIKDKEILYSIPDVRGDNRPTGSAYVRVILPYQQRGIMQDWRLNLCSSGSLPNPDAPGVAIIQRRAPGIKLNHLSDWLSSWHRAGGKLIYEIDDDLMDKEGLIQRNFIGDLNEIHEKVEWLACNADVVTTSTRSLADKLRQFNENIVIVENYLDENVWQLNKMPDHMHGEYARQKHSIKMGYIGTATHTQDLVVIADAVKMIESEFGDSIGIEVIGAYENMQPIFGKKVPLPRNTEYPNFVEWLIKRVHWDIGLIPLADDMFNNSKSHLKFLEYAALDMAIICSDVESYRGVAKNRENCLMVRNDTTSWYQAIKELIESNSLREILSANAARMVRERYTTTTCLPIYKSVLKLAADQDIANVM